MLEGARRSRFIAKAKTIISAVPLAAALITGCADRKDECRTYNDTTVTLNQQADGRSAMVKDLERIPAGSFLSAPQIDFINETHALSSEGLPDDVKATQVPAGCAAAEDPGRPKSGYAQPDDADGRERGIYITENPGMDPISLINLANHEIGHLQANNPPNGFEVLSQLNEYEQQMAGFALLALQGDGALTRWQSHMAHPGISRRLMLAMEPGKAASGPDAYDRANMLIFNKLVELDGDFRALRSQVAGLVQGSMVDGALDDAVSRFLSGYTSEADTFIEMRMRILNELGRRFGLREAYFEANSMLLDAGLAYGLEGLNCAFMDRPASEQYEACAGQPCAELGANLRLQADYSLCCLAIDGPGYSRWSVRANGVKYRNGDGMITVDGFGWEAVSYLTASGTPIGIGEPCG